MKALEEGVGAGSERMVADKDAELARLRRENKELRMEEENLNKVSAYLANDMR